MFLTAKNPAENVLIMLPPSVLNVTVDQLFLETPAPLISLVATLVLVRTVAWLKEELVMS